MKKNILFSLISAVLLILAFPKTNLWVLAWIGLIPTFFLLDGKSMRASFGWGYLTGFLFFLGTQYWLAYVDPLTAFIGLPVMAAYLALYFGFFGLGYQFFARRFCKALLFIIPSLWVGLEFLRAHLFTGFSWASLGLSQASNLVVIQIADVTGMFGVSFLIIFVNLTIKRILEKKTLPLTVGSLVVVLGIVLWYGNIRLSEAYDQPLVKVGIVQGNISQEDKWDESQWSDILEKHARLSFDVLDDKPDVIVWPETAFPGFFGREFEQMIRLGEINRALDTPLLLGSVTEEAVDEDEYDSDVRYYNSALLFSKEALKIGQYNKIHLVPFGEFIPFRSVIPVLTEIIPIADFTAAGEFTVMDLPVEEGDRLKMVPFSAFICFEDSVVHMARGFVNNGAQFLVNLTNDAWFGDSMQPFMHFQSSILRAVENRRSIVRATNTGVSGVIAPSGKVVSILSHSSGDQTFVSGVLSADVPLNTRISFYTKFGDVFVFLCFGCILGGIFLGRKEN